MAPQEIGYHPYLLDIQPIGPRHFAELRIDVVRPVDVIQKRDP